MKIVINSDYGGYSLSDECRQMLGITSNDRWKDGAYKIRTNPKLIKLMETKGSKWCGGYFSSLKIVEIPDDVDWELQEFDGKEWIAEKHRTWR